MTLLPHINYPTFKSLLNAQQNSPLLIKKPAEIILANTEAQTLLGYNNIELHSILIRLLFPDFTNVLLNQI